MLATLDYLEQQRRLEHDATRSANDEIAERWQTITQKTQHLRDLNQHNGWLLEGQIERNQQAIQVLKPHQEPALYGANGQTSAAHRGGKNSLFNASLIARSFQASAFCRPDPA